MSYTKRQLIEAALAELGMASYSFDVMPEQIETALHRLDAMMAEWNARGLRLGYSLPRSPELSDASNDSGIPDSAWDAVITNLAVRLAPSYGKAVSAATMMIASHAMNTLYALMATTNEMRLQAIPCGAGSKQLDAPFLPDAPSDLVAGHDGTLDFN